MKLHRNKNFFRLFAFLMLSGVQMFIPQPAPAEPPVVFIDAGNNGQVIPAVLGAIDANQGFAIIELRVAGNPNFYFIQADAGNFIFEKFAPDQSQLTLYFGNNLNDLIAALEREFPTAVVQELIEDLKKQAEVRAQEVTAQAIADLPGSALNEVFGDIVLGKGGRPKVKLDGGAEAEEEGEGEERAATEAAALADSIAAQLKYTRFNVNGAGGNTYGITLGWERETENSRYGVLVPYDRIDFDGSAEDGDSFTFTPFYQFIPLRDPFLVSVGPYAIFNYTFLNDLENFTIWGAGLAASIEYALDFCYLRVGAAGEYLDADIDTSVNSVVRLRYGALLGVPLSELLEARLFYIGTLADERFVNGDDEFGAVGVEAQLAVSEAFALTVGYLTDVSHDSVEAHTAYLGGIFALR